MSAVIPRSPAVFGDVELDAELHSLTKHDIRGGLR
jgi:hypothetical protein